MARNWPGWSGLIFWFRSHLFRVVLVRVSGFISEKDFWLDLARSGRNLVESVEIWPRFHQIMARSRRIWSRMLNISPKMLKVSEIWSGMLNISPETLKVSIWVRLHEFWNAKSTTDPLGLDLTIRNSRPNAEVFGSSGGGSDLARVSGSAGLLDSPSWERKRERLVA